MSRRRHYIQDHPEVIVHLNPNARGHYVYTRPSNRVWFLSFHNRLGVSYGIRAGTGVVAIKNGLLYNHTNKDRVSMFYSEESVIRKILKFV